MSVCLAPAKVYTLLCAIVFIWYITFQHGVLFIVSYQQTYTATYYTLYKAVYYILGCQDNMKH